MPIVGVILMLSTPRAQITGPAFLLGWLAGIAGVGTVVLLAASAGDASQQGQPEDWVSVVKLVLGAMLLVIARRQWKQRPRPGETAEMPEWMATVDGFSAVKAAGFGVLLSAVNPKNLLLVAGGAAAIAGTGTPAGSQAAALAAFTAIATLGTATPLALYYFAGDETSKRIMGDLKNWMSEHNAAIMAVLCLLLGAKLIGDAISSLSV